MRLALLVAVLIGLTMPAQARILATSDITVYVSPAGSDTMGDGSAAHPWATPQHAADELYDDYDLRCKYKATIQLVTAAPGSYNFYPGLNISGRLIGQCGTMKPLVVGPGIPPWTVGKYLPFTLQGDTTGTNPNGAFLYPPAGGGACISMSDGAALRVVGITCDTSLSNQDGFDIFDSSYMDMSNVWFGNAGTPSSGANHVSVGFGSRLIITGNYGMSGGAYSHILAAQGSTVIYENNTGQGSGFLVTVQGNLAFPAGFMAADSNSSIYAIGVSYGVSGTVTGPTAKAARGSVIDTTGHWPSACNANYFPGNAAVIIQGYSSCL